MTADFSARTRQYQDALYEALAGDETAVSDAEPLSILSGLLERCRPLAIEDSIAVQALDALGSFAERPGLEAALSDVAIRFESPQRFREALFFARCLERDADSALALLDARAYLEAAITPAAASADLAVDQAALLDGNTFATLWREPGRGVWLVDTIDIWKQAYLPLYVSRHAAHNAAVAEIAQLIDAAQTRVAAVERLNTLQRLGAPQAQAALTQYHELETQFACPATEDDLTTILQSEPACPYCAYHLGEEAPTADANRVLQAIQRGLEGQQARLAQRVVNRLLARSGRPGSDRLDRFIEVVQAADLTGLAAVLDDGLIAFLQDLLDSPPPTATLLDSLSRTFPEITADNLDDAVVEFRLLLQEELQRNNGAFHLRAEDHDA
ncbi:MAG TPA: hypothetical protein VFS30_13665 [Dehalococcoidia bacterium]|nr:hypothetical protein [Dehalococcoidia bacterium]